MSSDDGPFDPWRPVTWSGDARWRTEPERGLSIYAIGEDGHDVLLGAMTTVELANRVVNEHNDALTDD